MSVLLFAVSLFLIFFTNSTGAKLDSQTVSLSPKNIINPLQAQNLNSSNSTVRSMSASDAPKNGPQKIISKDKESLGIELTANSALVIDKESGSVLFEKNSEIVWPLASLTKLMSAIVWLEENLDLNKEVKITSQDKREGGIEYVIPGDMVKLQDLFFVSLIGSDNTAAAALSRSIGIDEKQFVSKMNQKTTGLGLENTFFIEPTGLNPANRGTSGNIAKLASLAFREQLIKEALTRNVYYFQTLRGERRKVINTDHLLESFLNDKPYKIIGGKTGYLEESGYNLVLEAERGGHNIIVVVLGSKSMQSRFQEAKALTVWAFQNYRWPN